jgi:hypothetical protein
VIDVSNPATPRKVGALNTSGSAQDVVVSGDYAYVADYTAGLQVIDIRDPVTPRRVGASATGGYAYSLCVSGGYAYVACSSAGLQVIDSRDPALPIRGARQDTTDFAFGVAFSEGFAYVGAVGLEIFDISRPTNPVLVGAYNTASEFRSVAASGSVALLADGHAGLHMIDVSIPRSPQRIGGYNTTGQATEVVAFGEFAYLADANGLQVINVADPDNPAQAGGLSDFVNSLLDIEVSGDYAYVSYVGFQSELGVIDIHDRANPRRVGRYDVVKGSLDSFRVSGGYVYLLAWGSLQVIDVSDPANPHLAGDPAGLSTFDLVVAGTHAVVLRSALDPFAATQDGPTRFLGTLEVIDISSPSDLRVVGVLELGPIGFFEEYPPRLAMSGQYAYVSFTGIANEVVSSWLAIIDLKLPSQPRRVSRVVFSSAQNWDVSTEIAVSGDYAYVSDWHGLHVIDISEPANPRPVGRCTFFRPDAIAISEDRLFVADQCQGLIILDLFRPIRLQPLAQVNPRSFQLHFEGPIGASMSVQCSTNLINWEEWQTLTLGSTPIEISELSATDSAHAFYRGVLR